MANEEKWPTASYRLTQRSYIARLPGGPAEMLDEGSEIVLAGKPGPHMVALDDAGKRAHERAGPQVLDFTSKLDMTLGEDNVVRQSAAALAEAFTHAMTQQQKKTEGASPPADLTRSSSQPNPTPEPAPQYTAPPAPATNPQPTILTPPPPPPAPPAPPPPPPPPLG